MQKVDSLIRTKLGMPFIRSEMVSRPRLQEKIAQGLRGPLTLVAAPAGFGKTTLVASCISGSGMSVAWLSLNKDDNHIGSFLRYLVAALQKAESTIGNEAVQLLLAGQHRPPETVLTSLINDLDRADREIVLVLDDYQFINNQAVHDGVTFLLEHCPNALHLLIATRSDPPLPLTRLRARGQMFELRTADLRFSETEAAQFLNEVMDLQLDAGSVAVLEERTEGWIAGLQMAALSMRDRADVSSFIESFSGTHRYILDYLLEEVLTSQPPEIQHFLLYTSVLERLTAPLCEAVLRDRGIGEKGMEPSRFSPLIPTPLHPVPGVLEYLERANLFLVPLDDERIWYRYHQLFADLLRSRLEQLYPGLSPDLHRRAAVWYENESILVEAVNHTLAAGDYDRAARLVEENTSRLLAKGELNALMGWIEALPAQLRQSRPWLCIHQAYALIFGGHPAEVEPLLIQAQAALEAASEQRAGSLSIDTAEVQAIQGAIAAVRAFCSVTTAQDAEALTYVQQARQKLPADSLWDQAAVAWSLGYTMFTQGQLSEACLAFEEQIRLGRSMGNTWTLLAGLTYLAQTKQAQGELRQARKLLETALIEASHQDARSRGYIARVESTLASVLYQQNELEAAQHLLLEAIKHTHQWPNPNHMVHAHVLLARVQLAQGDLQGARTSIAEADKIKKSTALSRVMRCIVETELVRVWLSCQTAALSLPPDDPLAEQAAKLVSSWRKELAGLAENDRALMDACLELEVLSLAHVSLAAGQAEQALSMLQLLARSAKAAGHLDTTIHSLALSALARQVILTSQAKSPGQVRATGHAEPALTALEEALILAETGGYARVFLDEGQPMQGLLAQSLAHTGSDRLKNYARHLLSQFKSESNLVPPEHEKVSLDAGQNGPGAQPAKSMLVEPLSTRELEVLHLIALGRTNQEIARQLIVSPGTIKAHTSSIYRKLDVTNRTEAVARATQLGLLSLNFETQISR